MKSWILAIFFLLQAAWSNAASVSSAATPPTLSVEGSKDQYLSEYFGEVPINFSAYRAWSISNSGQMPLVIDRVIIRGNMFYARTNCPQVLQPQQRCTVEVQFQPFALGYQSGELDILIRQGGNILIDLWGYGVR